MKKSGFTLVELSIVLVIIGLLIGGILVAQSLIESVGIQSFVRQVQQIDAAVINFESKYRDLPGDSKLFDTAGDGDGKIEASGSNRHDLEVANFWRHLSQDGFLPDNVVYDNDASTGVVPGVEIPKASYGGESPNTGIVINTVGSWGVSPKATYYHFCDFSDSTSAVVHSTAIYKPAYKPSQMLSIDKKMDDGIVRATDMTNYKGHVSSYVSPGLNCFTSSGGNFTPNIDLDSAQCCIRVRIGFLQGGF